MGNKFLTLVKITGIWMWVTVTPALVILLRFVLRNTDVPWVMIIKAASIITLVIELVVFVLNISRIIRGWDPRDIGALDFMKTGPDEHTAGTNKNQYMYPRIKKEMLYDTPQGFCFGKDTHTGKYVCRRIDEEGAVLISGGSGTGKSSCYVINYLLWCKGVDIDNK